MAKSKKMPQAVKDAIKKKTKGTKEALPHLSELAEHFVQIVGGPRSMANMLHAEWIASRAGSIVRSRILDLITRVWRFSTETLGSKMDLGILSEEDIDRMIELQLEETAEGLSDGEPARSEEGASAEQQHLCPEDSQEQKPNLEHDSESAGDPSAASAGDSDTCS